MIHRRKSHCTQEEQEEWRRKDAIEIMLAIRDQNKEVQVYLFTKQMSLMGDAASFPPAQ